ncbi:hypothetical protein [Haladaptatus sp. DJG-WS-42]|uniref:hypothetical protein n=1 Tax=Haladaptatus sp. DJG-WS-42 TaxID=3120516 RepID=UPI0030D19F39
MNQSTINFILLFVGACVALAGVALFFPFADMDYHVEYVETRDAPSPHKPTAYFAEMSPTEQAIFEQVKGGGVVTVEDDIDYPEVVKYQGQYYYLSYFSSFDWLNPSTFGPSLIALIGTATALGAIRRDMRQRIIY